MHRTILFFPTGRPLSRTRGDSKRARRTMLTPQPSFRKLIGVAGILLLILFWVGLVASLAPFVGRWPVLVQASFYLITGIVWIIPLKPLVRWMQTGRFRAPPA